MIRPLFDRGQPGGVVVYQYTPKNLPKYWKIPKIHPNIPKIIPRYTLYLKFKESDIPNTRIYAAIHRIPNLKSPRIPYTQKPWPTLFDNSRNLVSNPVALNHELSVWLQQTILFVLMFLPFSSVWQTDMIKPYWHCAHDLELWTCVMCKTKFM